jgi:predicted small lipoprotein YifL
MRPAATRRAVIQRPVLLATLSFVVLAGCGVLGAPIPPEDVGVAPVIERQLRREGLLAAGASVTGSASRPSAPSGLTIEEAPIPPEPDPLPTPPWRSMGTR